MHFAIVLDPNNGETLSPEQLLHKNVQRFRGGLVFKAHRLLYHTTLGLRVIKKKKTREDKAVVDFRTQTLNLEPYMLKTPKPQNLCPTPYTLNPEP